MTATLPDMNRCLQALYKLSDRDPDVWVSVDALNAELRRESQAERTLRTLPSLRALAARDLIELSADESRVALTEEGLDAESNIT